MSAFERLALEEESNYKPTREAPHVAGGGGFGENMPTREAPHVAGKGGFGES